MMICLFTLLLLLFSSTLNDEFLIKNSPIYFINFVYLICLLMSNQRTGCTNNNNNKSGEARFSGTESTHTHMHARTHAQSL